MKNAQPQFNEKAAIARCKKLRVEWLGGEQFCLSLGGESGFKPGSHYEKARSSQMQLVIYVPDGGSDYSTVWIRGPNPGSESSVEARRRPAHANTLGKVRSGFPDCLGVSSG